MNNVILSFKKVLSSNFNIGTNFILSVNFLYINSNVFDLAVDTSFSVDHGFTNAQASFSRHMEDFKVFSLKKCFRVLKNYSKFYNLKDNILRKSSVKSQHKIVLSIKIL